MASLIRQSEDLGGPAVHVERGRPRDQPPWGRIRRVGDGRQQWCGGERDAGRQNVPAG
jgi:hypothetical protein